MLAREIEKEGIPLALITAMASLGKQVGANRIVTGRNVPHPCGDPSLPDKDDLALRRAILNTALSALQMDIDGPTIFDCMNI